MMRIGVIPAAGAVPVTIQCLRRHTDMPVSELRAKLTQTSPFIDFRFEHDILAEVRRCRALLSDLDSIGAAVRVWESGNGVGEREVPREFLHNWMRTLIGIARDTRDDMDREAAADEG